MKFPTRFASPRFYITVYWFAAYNIIITIWFNAYLIINISRPPTKFLMWVINHETFPFVFDGFISLKAKTIYQYIATFLISHGAFGKVLYGPNHNLKSICRQYLKPTTSLESLYL